MMNDQNWNIRLASEKDAENLWKIYIPYVLNTYVTFETEIPDLPSFRSRVKDILHTLPWLMCEYENQIAGFAYATDHRSRMAYQWTKELSVYIHDDFRRKKIATALYTTLIQLLKMQGVKNCLAGIALPNEASTRFHEKMGFTKVGVYHQIGYKLNGYRDVGWWELFIGEKNKVPLRIVPIKSIEGSNKFKLAIRMGLKYLN